MGDVVLFGHGVVDFEKLDQVDSPNLVLVPTGTTLKFYVDIGMSLLMGGPYKQEDFDAWKSFRPEFKPLPARWAVYNFELRSESTKQDRELALALNFGSAQLVTPDLGASMTLCTGDESTCPTPALRVQEIALQKRKDAGEAVPAAEQIPADRWKHHCNGILGLHQGNNLHWMCCTDVLGKYADEVKDYIWRRGEAGRLDVSGMEKTFADAAGSFEALSKLYAAMREAATSVGDGDVVKAQAFVSSLASFLAWYGAPVPPTACKQQELGDLATVLAAATVTADNVAAVSAAAAKELAWPVDLAALAADYAEYRKEYRAHQKKVNDASTGVLLPWAKDVTAALGI